MMTIPNELIGALIGFLGVIIGVFLTYLTSILLSKYTARQSLTFDMLKTYNSVDFLFVLGVITKLKEKWRKDNEKLIVNHFIPSDKLTCPKEELLDNKLTEHANLTLYLRFLAQLNYYYKAGLLDRKTIDNLYIKPQYIWNHEFLTEFKEVYFIRRSEVGINNPIPPWVDAIDSLNDILNNIKIAEKL